MAKYPPSPSDPKRPKRMGPARPIKGSSTRIAVGYKRKEPTPKKQGPEELAAINKYREMPKRIGKYDMAPREKREMPKRIPKVKKGTKGSFDDAVRTQNNQRQMLGSTKAQRAASALEMMNDMRSRNILRSRNLSSKPKKRGM